MATPGTKSTARSRAARSNCGVAPGLSTRLAPAARAWSSSAGLVTVPAATRSPGTRALTARILSSAAALRRVISIARIPPRCSAPASWTVDSTSTAVTTGNTRQSWRMDDNTLAALRYKWVEGAVAYRMPRIIDS